MKYKVGDRVRINIPSYNKEDTNSISSCLLNIYMQNSMVKLLQS